MSVELKTYVHAFCFVTIMSDNDECSNLQEMDGISNYQLTSSENLRHKIYRNLAVLCFTFLGVFTAFQVAPGQVALYNGIMYYAF